MFIALLHGDVQNWRWKGTPGVTCPTHKAGIYLGLFPRLVEQQHRGVFGELRAPHPKSFPGACSCFGTHWQVGRVKFLPKVNLLFGKSCTFHLSLPGFFTPWIKHGINDKRVLQSSLKPTECKALCSCKSCSELASSHLPNRVLGGVAWILGQLESPFLEVHDSSLYMQCFWAEGPACAKEGWTGWGHPVPENWNTPSSFIRKGEKKVAFLFYVTTGEWYPALMWDSAMPRGVSIFQEIICCLLSSFTILGENPFFVFYC